MIPRAAHSTLQQLAVGYPVVVVTGPRQSGKTTLVRAAFADKRYVSLENPDERAFALDDPKGFLARFPDGAILDEVQHSPQLFSYLQTQVDLDRRMGLFVLTGSQHFGLVSQITQSLAGRAGILQLLPFGLAELVGALCTFHRFPLQAVVAINFVPSHGAYFLQDLGNLTVFTDSQIEQVVLQGGQIEVDENTTAHCASLIRRCSSIRARNSSISVSAGGCSFIHCVA